MSARNAELQRRLGSLKVELNAEGHDADTWLESCSDIDHSVSTRTASEAEMYRTIDDVSDDPHNESSELNRKSNDVINQNGNKPTSCKFFRFTKCFIMLNQ